MAQCTGWSAPCVSTDVTHVDSKGYVYCERCAQRGRRLTKAERARIASGLTLERY